MSLKVWLPLCGDLRQQGASDIVVSNNGTTVNTNGKIGSCYSFDGSSSSIKLSSAPFNNDVTEFSFSCWFKPTNQHNGCLFSNRTSTSDMGITLFYYNSSIYFDVGGRWTFTPTTAITVGQWNHLTFTYKKNVGKFFYLNGILKNQTTSAGAPTIANASNAFIGASQDSATTVNSNYLKGQLNDIRIYDHCLSAAEVHEISQGLVLHYKLNEPNPNMLLMTPKSYTPTTYCGYQLSLNENLIADQTYTLQLWDVTVEHSAKTAAQMNLCVYWGGGSIQLKNFNGTSNFKTLRDHYAYSPYLVATFTITSSQASGNGATNAWFNIYNSVGWVSGTVNMHIGTWKLEKGNIATSWTPNITTIIEDSSGYNHNGTILNTISISSDTPRYSCSTNLEAANSMINCGRGGMVTDSITVNFWLKSSTWANPVSCTEGGGWNFEASGDYFRFPIYISGVGYKNGQSATTKAQLCNNQWHMLTGIYDRINQKIQIYVDGQLDNDYATGTSNNIGYHSSNCIWIGAEATGSNTTASNGMAGLFSDFRIYCTALSAADVKQLYELGAKVDNKQNLHAFELIENSPIKITKYGQIKCQELNENENTKFYKTGIVETAEIIEL